MENEEERAKAIVYGTILDNMAEFKLDRASNWKILTDILTKKYGEPITRIKDFRKKLSGVKDELNRDIQDRLDNLTHDQEIVNEYLGKNSRDILDYIDNWKTCQPEAFRK